MRPTVAFLLFAFFLSAISRGADCSHHWEVFSHVPMKEFLFPDTGARYWRYRFAFTEGQRVGFLLKGRFPRARYMNLITYDHKTFDPIGTLTDKELRAETGSSNPFVHGAAKDVEARSYSVAIVPEGVKVVGIDNVLTMPTPRGKNGMEIWYRIYLPEGADATGEVGLPTLTAFSLDDGKPAACPSPQGALPPLGEAMKNLPPHLPGDDIYTFRSRTNGLFANRDNVYLLTRLPRSDVAVLRFRAPTFPVREHQMPTFDGETQVRYWSLCLCGTSTLTAGCVEDRTARRDRDDYVTLVVGAPELKALAEKNGFTFLPRAKFLSPLLLYRNLVSHASFPGLMTKVPSWSGSEDPEQVAAHKFIGDFAPKGRRCRASDFRGDIESGGATVCGVPRPRAEGR